VAVAAAAWLDERPRAARTTDTTAMRGTWATIAVPVLAGLAACAAAGPACGGGHCHDCGCGPRYWGAVHDEPWCPDPCDACARWRGCNGVRQQPEMLAPWQLPPGRGFAPAQQFGWRNMPCVDCANGCPECHVRYPARW
jgi:hypothetical protein